MKIWLGSLEAYNNGELTGEWIDLSIETHASLKTIISKYTNEGETDYFIADWETDIEGLKIKEHSNPFKLLEIQEQLGKLDDYDKEKIDFLLSEGCDFEEALEKYEDVSVYDGNLKDTAEQLVDDGCFGTIPSNLANYIDYEAIGRDLRHDGYTEHNGKTYHYA
jgi:antirestriction protein